ncbi:uncharacterized protein LOC113759998 [Coffea eugenioides]|uniref:uncharacterized protein LOC113759998 n=1 Tax=Coffea eugenioides TaxID=49369 RepID=UPI000F610435|nr:uncharacterized protein LOC113759998 [Coffea eugenioides]
MHSISLVAICEPKTLIANIDMIRMKVGMDFSIANLWGSIWVLYKSLFDCQMIGESNQHLTLSLRSQLLAEEIYFSFIHSKCTVQEREGLWIELLNDKPEVKPWFLVGDFNVILNAEKKRGGLPFRHAQGIELSQFMSLAEVGDAGFSGSRYTWCNNRKGILRVWKRLDRLLLNSAAMLMESNILVQHLGRNPSDHAPLLISASTRLDDKPRPFKFLNIWTTKPGFMDVINESWSISSPGSPLQVLSAKLRRVKQALRLWSRESVGDIFLAIRTVEHRVLEAEIDHDNHPLEKSLVAVQEARARLKHTLEVNEVIFSMDEESAAGPDGFTGKFFMSTWEVVAMDIQRAIVRFFCGTMLPRSVSATSIVLLPKIQCPQDFTQYRPISLCNFINKVISKILSFRLAKVLPHIISP